MTTVAVIDTVLRTKDKAFKQGMSGALSSLKKFKGSFSAIALGVTAASAGMATAIATQFARLGDEIDKASKRTQT